MQSKFAGDYQKNEMPKWMVELHTKMSAKDAPHNVPLFIAKIICNRPAVCYIFFIFVYLLALYPSIILFFANVFLFVDF